MGKATMTSDGTKYSVLFVCLGNICRSPLAEAVFAHVVKTRGLTSHFDRIDSAGTAGYHIGEEPDERSQAVCRKNGVPIDSCARQLARDDFGTFTHIVGMDDMNMRNIERIKPAGSRATVRMFGSYGDGKAIQDPYYGGSNGFQKTYGQCVAYSDGLLADLGFGDAAA